MKKEKEPLLEKLFILLGTIDAITLTLVFFFITGILTICVFLGCIMFTGEGAILFYKGIVELTKSTVFTSLGFFGLGFLYLIPIILLWSLLVRLIKCYPSAIRKLKAYLLIENLKEPKPKKKKTALFIILIIILVLAIAMITTSMINKSFDEAITFARETFDFENIGEAFMRWIHDNR